MESKTRDIIMQSQIRDIVFTSYSDAVISIGSNSGHVDLKIFFKLKIDQRLSLLCANGNIHNYVVNVEDDLIVRIVIQKNRIPEFIEIEIDDLSKSKRREDKIKQLLGDI